MAKVLWPTNFAVPPASTMAHPLLKTVQGNEEVIDFNGAPSIDLWIVIF